ncbi:discoidin domain-containing protein [Lachnoclostridium sp.]|uniref:discoidin domain-containing protein n=1 Tax=Lachnoclostridium sp. TaxID=2028282 RepID=UPI0028A21763|nr:discoidin domain-containing protein [Lachnoclostridium sp.]
MALIDITPIMTSNTTPAPYVVSASSIYSDKYEAWRAFDSSEYLGNWTANSTSVAAYLQIDFNIITKINAFSIASYTGGSTSAAFPKDFILYGSNDGINFEQIIEINNQILWKYGTEAERRLYRLNKSVAFRFYRLNIITNNGFAYSACGNIKFWQDDGITETITNKKASLAYCLPKNSTLIMKQRQSDPREGLLGYADDSDNYGTLWMIGKDGKAIIPKAAIADYDVLFDGVANTISTPYTMSKSYKEYSYLLVLAGIDGGTRTLKVSIIPTKLINISTTQFSLSYFFKTNYYYGLHFGFETETSFTIGGLDICTNWKNAAISKIYGIR